MQGILLATLASLSPLLAIADGATSISDCEYGDSYGANQFFDSHKDLGTGFVMYARRFPDWNGAVYYVVDCASGATLTIDPIDVPGKDGVENAVLTAANSPDKVTLARLRDLFAASGSWTRLSIETVEHCACAAFYPESRGDKADWQSRLGHP